MVESGEIPNSPLLPEQSVLQLKHFSSEKKLTEMDSANKLYQRKHFNFLSTKKEMAFLKKYENFLGVDEKEYQKKTWPPSPEV